MTDTATRERPILFSGAMVRAILSGEKTQTRRVVKCLPALARRTGTTLAMPSSGRLVIRNGDEAWDDTPGRWEPIARCPYGQPGDRLWVRESFIQDECVCQSAPAVMRGRCNLCGGRGELIGYAADGDQCGRKRPSIHMPRWASRITLEITNVRVERLQAITSDDAKAEGVERDTFGHWLDYALPVGGFRESTSSLMSPVDSFRSLWDSINQARGFGWDANPWCWCIDFKRLEADNEA